MGQLTSKIYPSLPMAPDQYPAPADLVSAERGKYHFYQGVSRRAGMLGSAVLWDWYALVIIPICVNVAYPNAGWFLVMWFPHSPHKKDKVRVLKRPNKDKFLC